MTKTNIFFRLLWLVLICTGFVACTSELEPAIEEGNLRLSFGNISTTTTRSTPSELGTPVASDFNVRIVNAAGRAVYDAPYSSTSLTVPTGEYSIQATKGENPLMAFESPYYVGETTAIVEKDETTTVSLTCKVGNSLVSVAFGSDEEEAARFARFYSDYELRVAIGKNYFSIIPRFAHRSVYVRAGSTVELYFAGTLVATGDEVVTPVPLPEGVSNTLQAADHLKVTLGIEEVENEVAVQVTKAEVESVTVEESLTYNYLPAPTVTTEHRYDRDNELMGTNIEISSSFPGMTWTAQIHQGSASGPVVRTLSGTGALSQTYREVSDWPFLPAGTYVATFSYTGDKGATYNYEKTRTFVVEQPTLTLTADAYTSYSKYEEGDIAAANACERLTVYEPTAYLNVSKSLMANPNYAPTFTYSIAGKTATVQPTDNTATCADFTGVPVSGDLQTMQVVANFGGQEITATKQVRITGMPYNLDFNSHSEWSESGSVTWDTSNVYLGYMSTGGQSITTSSSLNIPKGTKYCGTYNVNVSTGIVGTTFTITAGSQEIYSVKENGDGSIISAADHRHTGTTLTFTANKVITTLSCKNTYGAGYTCSYIYSLALKYAE